MDFSFSTNDKYKKPALTMLYSFFQNNHERHTFHFLYSNTSERTRVEYQQLIEKNGCEYREYQIDESLYSGFKNFQRYGITACYRLLLPFVIPEEIEKIVWLDSDIAINSCIEQIAENTDSKCVYGVNYPEGDRLDVLGIKNGIYLNSGVMVLNLKLIRQDNTLEDVVLSFIKNQDKFIYPDQCFVNFYYKNKIGLIDQKYNYVVYRSKKINKTQLKQLEETVCIFHYVGFIKPWNAFYDNLAWKAYWRYARKIFGGGYFLLWKAGSSVFTECQKILKK